MFTGLIEDLGKVEKLLRFRNRLSLTISCRFAGDLSLGDSIAVNGVCLTVAEKLKKSFRADVVFETLSKTALNYLRVSDFVNLERPLSVDGRFDGHIVLGHVDSKSIITNIIKRGSEKEIEVSVPEGFGKFVASKGSVAVDGVSLTVASCTDRNFRVVVVPHTAIMTNLAYKKIGDFVNLEFDVIAKYLESLVKAKQPCEFKNLKDIRIDEDFLVKAGFLN